ncbi:AAA family ATPase [bacterium]|nr:AAA family ATPase [bacterium]
MDEKQITAIGDDEKARWEKTYDAIVAEIKQSMADFAVDQALARELTSQIVASTRDEEKAALASDEAVAHGLSKLRKNKSGELSQLLEQPYFARVVTEENGRKIEFRLGTASFPDERIIDWRKAPISKLYYDYKEGEEFCETIQGREREGIITLKRAYQGVERVLNVVETSTGTVYWNDGKWNFDDSSLLMSRKAGQDGHLPPILSLITPEQFRLITSDADLPMIIQGVAGSGKTTVALHRLAWLLHPDNSDIKPKNTLVVMLNRSLRNYVETTLPELGIEGVSIKTYYQWVHGLLNNMVGRRPFDDGQIHRTVEQFKSSQVVLELMEKYVASTPHNDDSTDYLSDLFQFYKFILPLPFPGFAKGVVCDHINMLLSKKRTDYLDDTLLLHLIFKRKGYYPVTDRNLHAALDHIVIDECQDFGAAEIGALLNALNEGRTITLVGDRAQKIVMGRNFKSWESFLADIGFKDIKPVSLNVSYRTTDEIMEIAHALRMDDEARPQLSAVRHGPAPRMIKTESPEITPAVVGQWVDERVRESAHSLSCVICRNPKDAKMLTDQLRKMGHTSVRLGYRDQFTFTPGVVVTNVNQVKGLEFRNVLVVEPTSSHYHSSNEEERNLLYVAVTRAEVMLDFVCSGEVSKLLPDFEFVEEVKDPEEGPERPINPDEEFEKSMMEDYGADREEDED